MEDAVGTHRSRTGRWIVVIAILGAVLVAFELWHNVRQELRASEEPVVTASPPPVDQPGPGPTPTVDHDRPHWED